MGRNTTKQFWQCKKNVKKHLEKFYRIFFFFLFFFRRFYFSAGPILRESFLQRSIRPSSATPGGAIVGWGPLGGGRGSGLGAVGVGPPPRRATEGTSCLSLACIWPGRGRRPQSLYEEVSRSVSVAAAWAVS